ncbi:hypothetical protein [Dyadobacter sandarakinus]|uniref:Uncharacterized protein n=1 Tax=Dyadobacter sandarakinus TaxID=2747268 RepID=A0ABX7I3H8_9BACT|nr:hypothetical protein [Dyadobacter sandarakinus]QRR00112.1 hypothetical protein HWI92_03900 [Dyadobacter sandarakinus]
MKKVPVPTEDAFKEALNNPGGWVYVIDEPYQGKEDVPSEHILGAWKVDNEGNLSELFEFNPNYKSTSKGFWRKVKRVFMRGEGK